MKKLIYGISFLALILTTIVGCQKKSILEDQASMSNDEILDLKKIDISTTKGMQSLIENFESNSDIKFKGNLINVKKTSVINISNLKSSVDTDNVILLEILTNDNQVLKVYSGASLENENEAIVFAEIGGVVSDEIKFTFTENNDGSTNFNALILSNKTGRAMSWGDCMQGFFSDPYIGTITQVAGVAGGLGCVPCAAVAGFYTGVAALGCLG